MHHSSLPLLTIKHNAPFFTCNHIFNHKHFSFSQTINKSLFKCRSPSLMPCPAHTAAAGHFSSCRRHSFTAPHRRFCSAPPEFLSLLPPSPASIQPVLTSASRHHHLHIQPSSPQIQRRHPSTELLSLTGAISHLQPLQIISLLFTALSPDHSFSCRRQAPSRRSQEPTTSSV